MHIVTLEPGEEENHPVFCAVQGALIRRLGVEGKLTSSDRSLGAIAGVSENSRFEYCYAAAAVTYVEAAPEPSPTEGETGAGDPVEGGADNAPDGDTGTPTEGEPGAGDPKEGGTDDAPDDDTGTPTEGEPGAEDPAEGGADNAPDGDTGTPTEGETGADDPVEGGTDGTSDDDTGTPTEDSPTPASDDPVPVAGGLAGSAEGSVFVSCFAYDPVSGLGLSGFGGMAEDSCSLAGGDASAPAPAEDGCPGERLPAGAFRSGEAVWLLNGGPVHRTVWTQGGSRPVFGDEESLPTCRILLREGEESYSGVTLTFLGEDSREINAAYATPGTELILAAQWAAEDPFREDLILPEGCGPPKNRTGISIPSR